MAITPAAGWRVNSAGNGVEQIPGYSPSNPTGSTAVATPVVSTPTGGYTGEQTPAQRAAAYKAAGIADPNPPAATIASIYGSGLTQTEQDINAFAGDARGNATAPVNEQEIRDRIAKQLQAETDALNRIYDEKLRVARIGGESALGSNAAISARRGLLGSDFGTAQNQKILDNNAEVYGGIDAERGAAIAALTSKGAAMIRDEIAQKNELKRQSTADYITFLGQQETRRTTRAKDAATRALSANIDLSSLDTASIKAIADSYQISPDALLTEYTSAKAAKDKAKLEADKAAADLKEKQLEAEKKRYITLADGVTLYDPTTGKIVAENPKNFAPKAPPKSPLPIGKGTPTGFTQTDIKQGDAVLRTGRDASGTPIGNPIGPDGYIDPAVYVKLLTHWTQNGGTRDAFFSYYPVATYINPANTDVWAQLGIPNPNLTPNYKGTVPKPKTTTGNRSI